MYTSVEVTSSKEGTHGWHSGSEEPPLKPLRTQPEIAGIDPALSPHPQKMHLNKSQSSLRTYHFQQHSSHPHPHTKNLAVLTHCPSICTEASTMRIGHTDGSPCKQRGPADECGLGLPERSYFVTAWAEVRAPCCKRTVHCALPKNSGGGHMHDNSKSELKTKIMASASGCQWRTLPCGGNKASLAQALPQGTFGLAMHRKVHPVSPLSTAWRQNTTYAKLVSHKHLHNATTTARRNGKKTE